MMTEMVSITQEEYDDFLIASHTLSALECGGVDNWNWYHDSIIDYCNHPDSDNFDPSEPSYRSITDLVNGIEMNR